MRRNKFKTRKFENLEDRRMMAGDISFANGILTITGDSLDDVAVVRFEEDEVHVDLDVEESDGGTDGHSQTEDIADVTRIVFNGFAGDDRLTVFVDQLDQGVTVNDVVLEFNGEGNNDELFRITAVSRPRPSVGPGTTGSREVASTIFSTAAPTTTRMSSGAATSAAMRFVKLPTSAPTRWTSAILRLS